MRVHGSVKIVRKTNTKTKLPYPKYLASLREDFGRICGYCGKSELVTKNSFEIDHFVPKRISPERENDYSNLVYSCYECNRKKASKWPPEDKNIQYINGIGFVDPASEEYDDNLERNAEGRIVGKTIAGKYMVEQGLEFSKRPIKEVYQAMQLIEKKHHLEDKIKTLSKDESKKYIDISIDLERLQQMLFDYKE